MTWIITIVTFLATLIAFGILLFLYLRRKDLRDALKKPSQPRLEARTPVKVRLELSQTDAPDAHDVAFSKNVSHHGLCALTKKRWTPQSTVEVKFDGDMRAPARIAYCNRSGAAFIIGLQFSTPLQLTYNAD